jgi:UDP-glucose 4-epimerase
MRVLVTGSEGFIGSETVKLLTSVNTYDLMDGRDIRDREQFSEFVAQHQPDRILHLAAIARFQDADKNPLLAAEINIFGTLNVVEVCRKFHIPLVFSSTGSVLMPLDGIDPPYGEDVRARGNSQYGCSKAVGEQIVKRHTPSIVLRYAHIYGREKRHHGLIGAFADRIARGMQPRLYGGAQTNDFIYVKDVARANKMALEASWDCWDHTYNIGTGRELSAEAAGKLVCEVLGYEGEMERIAPRTVDPGRFVLDVRKAERMLGFRAEYCFKAGLLDMTVGDE